MSFRNVLIYSLFLVLPNFIFAQHYIADLDWNRIEQESIRGYLQAQINGNIATFEEIRPSLYPNSQLVDFNSHKRTYSRRGEFLKLYSEYTRLDVSNLWATRSSELGLVFSKPVGKVFYPGDSVGLLSVGQIIYVNIRFLGGLYNLPVAFEITSINDSSIEYSYVLGNITEGKQQIFFEDDGKGNTRIIHQTYFKSDHKLRDRLIYPFFHTLLINRFHRGVLKRIRN